MNHATLSKKTCKDCQERHALYTYRGRVRYSADHPLCPGCFRRVMDHSRAMRLRGSAS